MVFPASLVRTLLNMKQQCPFKEDPNWTIQNDAPSAASTKGTVVSCLLMSITGWRQAY